MIKQNIPEGKIDIHNTKQNYERALKKLREDRKIIKENKKLILDFIKDCKLGKTIKHREKKKIGDSRCKRYMFDLRKLSNWIGKPFDKVTQKDMEKFITDLENDKLKKQDKNKYSERTKVDMKKTLKKFYKWLRGNNDRYPEIVSWIDTYVEAPEIPALTREEVERMVAQTASIRDKAIIMLLFDSGARIEEFLNVRLKNLIKKEDYYMIRIEHSKTKPRTISLPMCTRIIEEWLAVHPDRNNPEAQLVPIHYDNLRMILNRIGRRVLNKNVNPHLFRHSSVTYYCNKLTQFQLCYRYGWSMASKQPARYIDREGVNEQQTARIIKSDEIGSVKKENQELREDMIRLRTSYGKIENTLHKINDFMGVFAKKKEFRKLIAKEGQVGKLMEM